MSQPFFLTQEGLHKLPLWRVAQVAQALGLTGSRQADAIRTFRKHEHPEREWRAWTGFDGDTVPVWSVDDMAQTAALALELGHPRCWAKVERLVQQVAAQYLTQAKITPTDLRRAVNSTCATPNLGLGLDMAWAMCSTMATEPEDVATLALVVLSAAASETLAVQLYQFYEKNLGDAEDITTDTTDTTGNTEPVPVQAHTQEVETLQLIQKQSDNEGLHIPAHTQLPETYMVLVKDGLLQLNRTRGTQMLLFSDLEDTQDENLRDIRWIEALDDCTWLLFSESGLVVEVYVANNEVGAEEEDGGLWGTVERVTQIPPLQTVWMCGRVIVANHGELVLEYLNDAVVETDARPARPSATTVVVSELCKTVAGVLQGRPPAVVWGYPEAYDLLTESCEWWRVIDGVHTGVSLGIRTNIVAWAAWSR